jgi:hypothetical protein
LPEPIDSQLFVGPHPTVREFVQQLGLWGFIRRGEHGVHTVFRGPHGGTVRVVRSELGRADAAVVGKAARLAGVTAAAFWAGPPPRDHVPQVRRAPARDSVIATVLSVHISADRPLTLDQVVEFAGNRVTRSQVSKASATLARGGQPDRIRSGVYQWSAGQRALGRVPEAWPTAEHPLLQDPGREPEKVSAAELFSQLFPLVSG